MILLTSNGLSSETLLREMQRQLNPGRAALVVTADNEYKEKNYHVPRLKGELELIGFEVEYFDFDTRRPAELMQYDLVEMIGGNPYYLLDSIRKNGFSSALRDFAEKRSLIGCSAGALVVTPSLELIDYYSPEMNIVDIRDLSALNLTDIQILPHYSKLVTRYDTFEEICVNYEQQNNCRVVRLNDGDAVLVSDGTETTIRK